MDEQKLQKIISEEKEYGVDYEKIEQRYHFVPANRYEMEFEESHDKEDHTGANGNALLNNNSNDNFDAIYLPPGSTTPSQSHSISPQDELRLRIAGAEMILQAGYSLKLPWYTIATGQALFQRFYYRVSFLDYDIRESIMACLFIATKIQESPRKLRDVTTAFYHVFQVRQERQPPIPVLNSASDYYQYIKQMVMESERIVLKELGFELYRLTEHPHNFLLDFLKRLKVSKEVAKKAWNYANDSYRGTINIHYPQHVVAVSCLYLAIWTSNAPMPKNIWWAIFDTSIKHIMEVCSDLLYLYELPKTDMKDIKEIIDAGYQANHLEKEFGFDHEETFEILKRADKDKEEVQKNARERDSSRRKSDSRRHSQSRASNKHSPSRSKDRRDRNDRNKYSRDHRSPKRRRSRSKSKDRRKKKYSRSPSRSEGRRGKKGKYDRSDSEESPRRRKDSYSESKKKKKRERSRERSKDRKKDKEREKDDKHSKHKRDKEKHTDKSESKKEKEKDQDREKERSKTDKDDAERKEKSDNKMEEISKNDKPKEVKETDKKISQELEALKQESLGKSKSTTENSQTSEIDKIKSSLKGFAEQMEKMKQEQKEKEKAPPKEEDKNSDSSSDEDTDKLLELKKKIMENKKKGAGKK